MKGSVPCKTPAGGERVGVTLTFEEKVGSKDLAKSNASRWLNLSDHFWSSSAILLSVSSLVLTGLEDFEVENFSFLDFFCGAATAEGDLTVP